MPTISPRALAAIPTLLAFVVAAAVLVFVVPLAIALPVAVALGVAGGWWITHGAAASVLGQLGAEPLESAAEPRLESLLESICASHGISEPRLYLIESEAIDALAVGSADDARLVVTTGLLSGLDRLEIEAVVARELSTFGRGTHCATLLVVVAPLLGPLASRFRRRLLDDRRLALADIDAVKLTRYPPGLASAFEKALGGARISYHPGTDYLWMIGPIGTDQAVQPPLTERIDTLREL